MVERTLALVSHSCSSQAPRSHPRRPVPLRMHFPMCVGEYEESIIKGNKPLYSITVSKNKDGRVLYDRSQKLLLIK